MICIPRVILAGGKAKKEVRELIGSDNRALFSYEGKSLLLRVVEALKQSDPHSPICVVGDVPEDAAYQRLPDGGDFVQNLLAGVSCFADAPFVLISTSDLPFLTGEIVSDLVARSYALAESSGARAIYPVVPVSACYARFPDLKRTAIRLKETSLTGGNLMLARPDFLLSLRGLLGKVYQARKNPVELAQMLGVQMVVRLLLAQTISSSFLTVPQLEASASRLVGGTVRALLCDAPEIATDLDRVSDFAALKM